MHRTRHCLIAPLVLVFAALTGCTEATSSPLLSPEAVREVICVDPTGPGCDPNAAPLWPTYPTDLPVEQVINIDSPDYESQYQLYGNGPELSDCEIGSRIEKPSDADGYGQTTMITRRSATCPLSPCYPQYLSARAEFHEAVGGVLMGGAIIGSYFLGPAGKGFRFFASRFGMGGLAGYMGWSAFNSYRVASGNFQKCVGENYGWFNSVTVIR